MLNINRVTVDNLRATKASYHQDCRYNREERLIILKYFLANIYDVRVKRMYVVNDVCERHTISKCVVTKMTGAAIC